MKTNNKIVELKKTKNALQKRIRNIIKYGYQSNESLNINFYPDITHHSENDSTSTNIFNLERGMKSKILSDDVFNRIICIKGSIKIHFIPFKEEVIVSTPNTQLILPNTKYIIEALEDSEIISIYKSRRIGENFTFKEQETIYNKKTVGYE